MKYLKVIHALIKSMEYLFGKGIFISAHMEYQIKF